jgi:DNA-binding transcriptional MerR regulator
MRVHLTIGELAKQTGVKVVTIRYYEQIGLLQAPARTDKNYRRYTAEQVSRLSFVRRCRDLGFSLDQVRNLLRLAGEQTAPSCEEVCRIADEHLSEVEQKIGDLERLASELRRISSSCSGKRRMTNCGIIQALSVGRQT